MKKRFLALVITLCMVLSLIPVSAFAADGSSAAPQAEPAAEPVRATKTGTVLAFTSDTHNKSGNVAANRLGTWLDNMISIYGGIDAMAFGGDMADASASESNYWTLTQADMTQLTNRSVTGVYTTGNHEWSPGNYGSTSSSVKQEFKIGAEGKEGTDYRIYCLGSVSSSQSYSSQVSSLTSYLNSVGNDKPIFIITHFPLHYYNSSGGSGWSWGGRSTGSASDIIDVLNNAVAGGKKIVFLWGHNHTLSDTYYDEIYKPGYELEYADGSKKAIQFYYGGAGCMSDSEYSGAANTGSAFVKGKGLIVTINDSKQLTFTYYNENGDSIYTFSEGPAVAVTGVTVSPKSVTISAGKTTNVTATVAPADATNKAVTWTSSNTSIATVSSNGKVKGVGVGTATITARTDDGGYTDTCTVNVEASSQTGATGYVITIGDYALGMERSTDQATSSSSSWGGSYTYTGLKAVPYSSGDDVDDILWLIEETDGGYYIMNQDGLYLNGTYTTSGSSWNQSSQGNLKLDDTPDVWVLDSGVTLDTWEVNGSYLKSTNASTGNSSEKYLAEETGTAGTHLFTVRSHDNADSTSVEEVSTEPAAVTGVTLDKATATVKLGKTLQLNATVAPRNATNKAVTWSSSKSSVATVDNNGLVTAVAVGTADITVTTVEGNYKAVCKVTVDESSGITGYVIRVNNYALSVNPSSDSLQNTGSSQSQQYNYTGLAAATYNSEEDVTDEIIWLIEPTNGGYYITSPDGRYLNATYTQNSTSGYDGKLKLDDTKDVWIFDGTLEGWLVDGSKLKSTNASTGNSSDKYLSEETGRAGSHFFTVRSSNNADTTHGEEASTDPIHVTNIALDKSTATVEVTRSIQLTATITPANATIKTVTWSSSKPGVATVDGNGKVTGVAVGTTVITATAVDGGATATCTVNVTPFTTPGYVIIIGDYAMSKNPTDDVLQNTGSSSSQKYNYTGLDGVIYHEGDDPTEDITWLFEETSGGYYITTLDGKYLSATYEANSTGGNDGTLTVGTTKDVWVLEGSFNNWLVNGSTLKSTNANKSLTHEEKSPSSGSNQTNINLFTVRSTGETTHGEEVPTGTTHVHVYGEPEWIWTGNVTKRAAVTASAKFTCVDGDDEIIKDADLTTKEENGRTLYTATVIGPDNKEYKDTRYKGETLYSITITPDKEYVQPGDEVIFTVTLSAVEHLGTMSMYLDVQSGLTYVPNSFTIVWEPPAELGADDLDWTEAKLFFNYFASGKDYSSTTETVLATFRCTVDTNFTGSAEAGFILHEVHSCEGDWPEYTDAYEVIYGEVKNHNHDWKFVDFTWTGNDTEGYTAAVANYKCEIGGTAHYNTVNATVTSETTAATCEAAGETVYTATVAAADSLDKTTHSDTKEVEIPATGHDWEFVNFTWTGSDAEGYTAAVANYKCKNAAAHTQTVTATVTSETTAATCEAAGETVYTATVAAADSLDKTAHSDTKEVEIPATGHDWEFVDFTWTGSDAAGYTAAVANYECKNNEEHTNTVNATVNKATGEGENAGYTVYTATVAAADSLDEAAHTDTKKVVIVYTIGFEPNEGTMPADVPETYTVESDAITLPTPAKEGFIFGGWFENEDLSGTAVTAIAKGSTGNKVFYAKWTPDEFTVTFDAQGHGTAPAAQTVDNGAKATEPEALTETGYTFGGWYKEAACTNEYDFDTPVTADITLYAKWTANTYTVKFNANGGTGTMADQSFTYDVSQTLAENQFTRANYRFMGWAKTRDGDLVYGNGATVSNLTAEPNGVVELFAVWDENDKIVVTFDKNGGEGTMAAQPIYKGVATVLTANTFTREGHTFAGWNTAADGKGTAYADGATVTFSADTILYAQWTINQYTVTFFDEDGTTVLKAATKYDYGTKAADIVKPADPTKEATAEFTYAFAGWDPELADVTEDAVYKATYTATKNKYTVTWKNYDGTVLETDQNVPYGTIPTYDGAEPARAIDETYVYTFDGWTPKVAAVTGNVTYTAKFATSRYATYVGISLTIKGDLSMNFYVSTPEEGWTIDIDYEKENATQISFVTSSEIYNSTQKAYKAVFNGVAAKEMTDKVILTVRDKDGNPAKLVRKSTGELMGDKYEYSIATWANNKIANTNTEAKEVEFAKALLNYGQSAQEFFKDNDHPQGYNLPDKPANPNGYLVADRMAASASSFINKNYNRVVPENAGELFGWKGATLILKGETSIRLYFNESPKVRLGSSTEYMAVNKNNTGYYVEVKGINSRNLDTLYTFNVEKGGETYVVKYGALSWCNSKLNDIEATDEEITISKALYLYNEMAEKCFGQQ